jgi:chorismate-pyruvate lyase
MNQAALIVPPAPAKPAAIPAWAGLLSFFYAGRELDVPPIETLAPQELPEPAHQLLAHTNDMTSTLEQFYRQPVQLRVLNRQRVGDTYLREIVLHLPHGDAAVEYGVICIHLKDFPKAVRHLILSEELPFGRILNLQAVACQNRPQLFFRTLADAWLERLFGFSGPRWLCGRRNLLQDGERRLLAQVIEILPPQAANLVVLPSTYAT